MHAAKLMEEQQSDSDSDDPAPGDDSDEEYIPDAPNAAEDSENEHGRKHIENDELVLEEHGHGQPRPKSRIAGRVQRWRYTPFKPNLVHFEAEDDTVLKDVRASWQALNYVEQYIDSELMKLIADCTNAMSLVNTGRFLNTSVDEMYHFFGAAILMSCVPYPQMRMFWSNALRIPAITEKITRDRFFKLRSHLKVVIDNDVPEEQKRIDRFWKVRPYMDRILAGCRLQIHPECVSIDEQMIPFTGACPFRMYLPLKPNPVGMKNFVMASVDGLVLDFEVYQGSQALALQVPDSDGLGLGSLVIKRLSETLTAGTKVYCDRFFTSTAAVDTMLKDHIYLTGTVMKNRVSQAVNKLPDDKTLKIQGRGTSAAVTREDGKVCVVKWYDNKPVMMLSTVHAEQPEDQCRRWSKKDKIYVTVTRPSVVREYNTNMGGVDRMISYYRMGVRTKKWTVRMLMHFTDLALANSWILYRKDCQERGTPRKAFMQFLEFRMVVAQVFLSNAIHCCPSSRHGSSEKPNAVQNERLHWEIPCAMRDMQCLPLFDE
ncbi:piggyBac transposable element-derived protein 3-like [Eleginops maclovinus]|uniref:piggyBac transposable element-derived protein 3-like n=1 Tax=Eleginops maclovinus TaxID=56733 RepID=UPI003080984A